MKRVVLTLALMAPGAALAQDYTDSVTGAVYVLEAQADGTATLTYPADPADSYVLRTDCSATHQLYGSGFWAADGGGWHVEIGGATIAAFPGSALPVSGAACGG